MTTGPEHSQADKAPAGNVKVTRDDWLNVALDVLVSDGAAAVKVQPLAARLGVSRSSFYWYFRSRQDLMDHLLALWEQTNTSAIVDHAGAPAPTITAALLNLFRCVVDARLFDSRLDFAVRAWARASGPVRRVLDRSDARRLQALTAMFMRYGYANHEAETRARVVYYMQIGYDDAALGEPLEDRLRRVPDYLLAFAGVPADPDEVERFAAWARAVQAQTGPGPDA